MFLTAEWKQIQRAVPGGAAGHGRVQGLPEASVHGVVDAHHLKQAAGADATELQVQGDQKHGPPGAAGRPAGLRSQSDDEQGHGDGKDPALHLQHHGPKQLLQHRHHRQLLLLVLVTCM